MSGILKDMVKDIKKYPLSRLGVGNLDTLKVLKKFNDEILAGRVQINLGLSLEQLNKFNDNYFDWVYIDTVHDYKTTIQELSLAAKKVKKGGIIAGHDYCQGNMITGWSYGVVQAVQ